MFLYKLEYLPKILVFVTLILWFAIIRSKYNNTIKLLMCGVIGIVVSSIIAFLPNRKYFYS